MALGLLLSVKHPIVPSGVGVGVGALWEGTVGGGGKTDTQGIQQVLSPLIRCCPLFCSITRLMIAGSYSRTVMLAGTARKVSESRRVRGGVWYGDEKGFGCEESNINTAKIGRKTMKTTATLTSQPCKSSNDDHDNNNDDKSHRKDSLDG